MWSCHSTTWVLPSRSKEEQRGRQAQTDAWILSARIHRRLGRADAIEEENGGLEVGKEKDFSLNYLCLE